jgi:hypothetical protein
MFAIWSGEEVEDALTGDAFVLKLTGLASPTNQHAPARMSGRSP